MIKGSEVFVNRGDIIYVDLPKIGGSVQGGKRPAIVVSNDKNNLYSNVVQIVTITSRMSKKPLPTHKIIEGSGLRTKSVALCETITTVPKSFIGFKIGTLNNETMKDVIDGVKVQLAM